MLLTSARMQTRFLSVLTQKRRDRGLPRVGQPSLIPSIRIVTILYVHLAPDLPLAERSLPGIRSGSDSEPGSSAACTQQPPEKLAFINPLCAPFSGSWVTVLGVQNLRCFQNNSSPNLSQIFRISVGTQERATGSSAVSQTWMPL